MINYSTLITYGGEIQRHLFFQGQRKLINTLLPWDFSNTCWSFNKKSFLYEFWSKKDILARYFVLIILKQVGYLMFRSSFPLSDGFYISWLKQETTIIWWVSMKIVFCPIPYGHKHGAEEQTVQTVNWSEWFGRKNIDLSDSFFRLAHQG